MADYPFAFLPPNKQMLQTQINNQSKKQQYLHLQLQHCPSLNIVLGYINSVNSQPITLVSLEAADVMVKDVPFDRAVTPMAVGTDTVPSD